MRKRKAPENRRRDQFRGFWLSADANTGLSRLMQQTGASAQIVLAELVKQYAEDPKFAKQLREMVEAERLARQKPTKPGRAPRSVAGGENPTRARPVTPETMAAWWASKKTPRT